MNTGVAAFILTVSIFAEISGDSNTQGSEIPTDIDITKYYPEECENSMKYPSDFRFLVWSHHNSLRGVLQMGQEKNGNEKEDNKFPTSSNMGLLKYDCELERSALNISRLCQITTEYDFSHLGSNSEIFPLSSTTSALMSSVDDFNSEKNSEFFERMLNIIETWWSTSKKSPPLENLMPTEKNRPMIPFLQMANGYATKVGCAYSICSSSVSSSSDLSAKFVCRYGDQFISENKPLYMDGKPCDTCPDSCYKLDQLCVEA
ncbi:hypothetical protein KIN20_006144 [Parelaphostrongylus tenuis]|uniref:SCP domain-containing protein n=1 Tax=Parelaphostrongylus tenuis TaxID=148309 RepID=A0AAD5QFR7_PARTN|nr:hypothetical protein KIN20_006144 [Parelaphostrongylus tenuis]